MGTVLEAHLLDQADGAERFFWHRLRWAALARHVPADRPVTILDVGAGAGATGALIARHRPLARYCFDEPIASLSEHLESRFGVDANLRGVDVLDGVGLVTLLDVIEHVEDDRGLLAETCARCAPGTLLAVTVPGSQRLWSQWDVDLGHHRRYGRAQVRALFAEMPVDIVEVSWLFPELVPAGLVRAWRHPAREDATTEARAEFPRLPAALDSLLYAGGRLTVALRRWAPWGTSVLGVARVR